MPSLSPIHLIIILVIALIVIGPGKLPEVGAALGKSIKEFRKAASDITDSAHVDAAPAPAPSAPVYAAPAAAPVYAPPTLAPRPGSVERGGGRRCGATVAPIVAAEAAPVPVAAAEAAPAPISRPRPRSSRRRWRRRCPMPRSRRRPAPSRRARSPLPDRPSGHKGLSLSDGR